MRTEGQMDMKFGRFPRLFERAYLRADQSAVRFKTRMSPRVRTPTSSVTNPLGTWTYCLRLFYFCVTPPMYGPCDWSTPRPKGPTNKKV
jgi:hypothetical protein